MAVREASTGAGRESLPARQRDLMRRAIRLEWITLAFKVVTIPLVGIVAGQSQAMKTAWYEDILELLPPVAFLVAARTIRRNTGTTAVPRPISPIYLSCDTAAHHITATTLGSTETVLPFASIACIFINVASNESMCR